MASRTESWSSVKPVVSITRRAVVDEKALVVMSWLKLLFEYFNSRLGLENAMGMARTDAVRDMIVSAAGEDIEKW